MSKKLAKSNPYLTASNAKERLIQNVATSTAIESRKSAKIYVQRLRVNSPSSKPLKR